jgi:hypothetical protein
MFEWLYIHMSLGRNGGFLFGFTTAVTLIFVLVGFPTVSWCRECLRVSESARQVGRRKRKHAQGIQRRGEAPFSGVVLFACLFRLLFASTAWVGWMAVWFALLSAFYRFGVKGLFDVLMWVGLACCGVAIASGVFAWVLTRSEAWKDEKEELYRAVDKSSK